MGIINIDSFTAGYLVGQRLQGAAGMYLLPEPWLDEKDLLGEQKIGTFNNLTTSSISCRRLTREEDIDEIYVGYVADGYTGLLYTDAKRYLYNNKWIDLGFQTPAIDISVCFDGYFTYSKDTKSQILITEKRPWIFWVTPNGDLKGARYGVNEELYLGTNATKVTAVRGLYSALGALDFGLILFELINGQIFYRQLIKGVWYDAQLVEGLPDVTWIDIEAFRTQDLRIGLHAMTSNGVLYEIFSQFQGIAKASIEHLSIDLNCIGQIYQVQWYHCSEQEHLSIGVNINDSGYHQYLYQIGQPQIVSIINYPNQNNDWGHIIKITFDRHLNETSVAENILSFNMIDSRGIEFAPEEIALESDGLTITFIMQNFNSAYGSCIFSYTTGTLYTYTNVIVENFSTTFTPQNLVTPSVPAPTVERIWNV